MRVRQPLLEAVVHYPGDHEALLPLLGLVADELNVKRVEFAESAERFGRWRAKPDFKALGPRLGHRVKDVAAALGDEDGALASRLAQGETVTIDVPGAGEITLEPTDVDLTQDTVEGWGVAGDGRLTVALELELTPELRREGYAREVVRLVQDTRKAAGLDVSDRIVLGLEPSGALAEALRVYAADIAAETLATELQHGELTDATFRHVGKIDGSAVTITLRPA
jgi:isoleucyl-tRNA synthetase